MINSETRTAGAEFSDCKRYRYRLWRVWDKRKPTVCFIMLNPSTADHVKNDPTVERCERRAVAMGAGCLEVVNLFALRSTDPKALYGDHDPVGPSNDSRIMQVAEQSETIICAWGVHGALRGRGADVVGLLHRYGHKLHVLGLTRDGHPRHPLYMGYQVQPVHWGPA